MANCASCRLPVPSTLITHVNINIHNNVTDFFVNTSSYLIKGSSNWMVGALQSHTSDSNTSSPVCSRWSLPQRTSPWRPWNSAPHPPAPITMPSLEFLPWKNSVTARGVYKVGSISKLVLHLVLRCAMCVSRFWYEGSDSGSLARWRNWGPRQTETGGREGVNHLDSRFTLVKKI